MSQDLRSELRRRLGKGAPALDDLSDGDVERLHGLLQAARQQQRDALAAAQEHALRFVPALLRKPLLKLLSE